MKTLPPVTVDPADFDATVQREILAGGRLDYRDATSAVIRHEKPVNHVAHALLTVLFCGLWAAVWIVAYINREYRVVFVTPGAAAPNPQTWNGGPAQP